MTVKDFYHALVSIKQILDESNPTDAYNQLSSSITQILDSRNVEIQEGIYENTAEIRRLYSNIRDRLDLVPHHQQVRETLNIDELVGEEASVKLDRLIGEGMFSAPVEIAAIITQFSELTDTLGSTIDDLNKYNFEFDEVSETAIISFEMAGESNPETTEQLRSKLVEIEKIIHAFARLTDDQKAFNKPFIHSLSKSSPLVIDIKGVIDAVGPEVTIYMLGKAIKWIMDRMDQGLDILLKFEDLKEKKLTNKKIEEGFNELTSGVKSDENTEEFIREQLIGDSLSAIRSDHESGSDQEIVMALKDAINRLTKLIEKGTTASVFIPVTVNEESEEARVAIEATRATSAGIVASGRRIDNKKKVLKTLSEGPSETEQSD